MEIVTLEWIMEIVTLVCVWLNAIMASIFVRKKWYSLATLSALTVLILLFFLLFYEI